MPLNERIDNYLKKDQHWKAKEMLQGRLCEPFDATVFEAYGRVLLEMNDTLEAGKYLFACGERKPEYELAIALYLKRYTSSDESKLLSALPKALRRQPHNSYPLAVVAELESLGISKPIQRKHAKNLHSSKPSIKDRALVWLLVAVFALLVIGFFVGVFVGLRTIAGALFHLIATTYTAISTGTQGADLIAKRVFAYL